MVSDIIRLFCKCIQFLIMEHSFLLMTIMIWMRIKILPMEISNLDQLRPILIKLALYINAVV